MDKKRKTRIVAFIIAASTMVAGVGTVNHNAKKIDKALAEEGTWAAQELLKLKESLSNDRKGKIKIDDYSLVTISDKVRQR